MGGVMAHECAEAEVRIVAEVAAVAMGSDLGVVARVGWRGRAGSATQALNRGFLALAVAVVAGAVSLPTVAET